MRRVAIVCINNVASGATARAIVAGMIVSARQGHDRIDETRFLQTEKNGIGTELRAQAAIAQFIVGFAGIFFAIGIAELRLLFAAAFKDTKDISRLRNFPAEEGL